MLYAREVTEVMGPYPGKQYRMSDIVREIIGHHPDRRRRHATREAVRLVLNEFERMGLVTRTAQETRGSFHLYAWRMAQVQDEHATSAS